MEKYQYKNACEALYNSVITCDVTPKICIYAANIVNNVHGNLLGQALGYYMLIHSIRRYHYPYSATIVKNLLNT